ncbi:MAG: Asp-tRNA(Asn)/Glu-tRNA(Gln) amidotransferase subunit GatC [Phycisphaerae bacterium]|jgi:aspartyl-tRNA(Asn)/glutamyl-tRNA(Gln) amidotransferase subunit C|nr:Asp-tRNA(Asn)/Glu-tRNA(Gln) amidotransferase subunit GatC [Phycisphaerae bacterium]
MALTRDEVLKVGVLSRIKLSDEDVETFASQLSGILAYIEKLSELDTENVEPLAHALDIQNVFRDDEPQESLGVEKALREAPEKSGDFFKVPRVLNQDEAGA